MHRFFTNTAILFITSSFLLLSELISQTTDQFSFWSYTLNTVSDDAHHAFNVGLGFLSYPTRIETNDMLYLTGAAGVTGTLFLLDQDIRKSALKNKSSFNDQLFKIDDYLNGPNVTYASVGIYLTGFFMTEDNLRLTGLYALETLFLAQSMTGILEYLFGRSRPYAGSDNMNFKIFRGRKEKYKSFPSGHTTNAFAFASIMAMSVDNLYWKTLWYGGAGLVGIARVYHNVHWFSDAFFAAAIGYTFADYVVNYDVEEHRLISIQPSLNGLSLKVHF